MADVFDKLKEMGIEVKFLEDKPDYKRLKLIYEKSTISDIRIEDPFKYDVSWICSHDENFVEWGDDDERGKCLICGSECDWSWVKDVVDEGHDGEGNYYAKEGQVREIGGWHPTDDKGIIGEIVEWAKEHWNDGAEK